MWKFIWFILVVISIVILGAMVFGIYYNLARLRKKVEDSWSHIEDELQVRIILADKLIDATKRDVGQENSILQNVVEAQSWLEYAETVHETVQANNMLIVALEELFILLEDPDIAISKRLKKLSEELEENEYLLSQYCSIYNEAAYMYNSKLQIFPNNMVANYFGLKDAEYFEPEFNDDKNLDFDPARREE
jgi:LemA protein